MKKNRKMKQVVACMLIMMSILWSLPSSVWAEGEYSSDMVSETEQVDDMVGTENISSEIAEEADTVDEQLQEAVTEEVVQDSLKEVPEETDNEISVVEVQEETGGQEPKAATQPTVKVTHSNPDSGSFTVEITGVTLSTGESLVVPIWQDEKQEDLIWNTAEAYSAGYRVTDSVQKHGNREGTYIIHVYRKSASGSMTFLTASSIELSISADSLTNTFRKDDNKTVDAVLKGTKTLGLVNSIRMVVWSSANGQDDLRWYDASETEPGSWKLAIPLGKHSGTGKYYVHAYAFTKSGQAICLKKSSFTLETSLQENASADTIAVTSPDSDKGVFTITIQGITAPNGINAVLVPVWSKADQSDLVWYTAEKAGDAYIVKGDLSRHGGNKGTYQIYAYVRDTRGICSFIGKTTMKTEAIEFSASVKGNRFTLSAEGISFDDAGFTVKSVVIPTWSQPDQSDLVWYIAVKEGNAYIVQSDSDAHSGHLGTYQSHLYLSGTKGEMKCIGKTSFTLADLYSYNSLTAKSTDEEKTFRIKLSGFQTDAEADSIRFAVWSEKDGQDDMNWYPAKKNGTDWYADVPVSRHGATGGYFVCAYYFNPEGRAIFIGKTSFSVKEKLSYNEITVDKVSADTYTVRVQNPNYDGTAPADVLCPTWSVEGGQDDIVWYSAKKQADGSYLATISRDEHLHDGVFITDVYLEDTDGNLKMLQRVTCELVSTVRDFDEEAKAVMRKIIYAVETGGQVYGNCRYDCFVQAYTASSAETAITIGAACWFATSAQNLLKLIRAEYPETFAALDTAGIGNDLDTQNWKYYGGDGAGGRTILKGSAKALAIQAIISSPGGIAIQDRLVDEQMTKYADQAKALGVTDLKARLFCANLQHLGGYSAMARIINYCIADGDPITMENLWLNMREREAGSGNKVGSDIYAPRHQKVMQWLNQYL